MITLVLFLVIAMLSHCADGRSLSWYQEKGKLDLLRDSWKRSAMKNEPTCPLFIGLINAEASRRDRTKCKLDYYKCSDDLECGPGLKCCYDGCIYFCTIPLQPRTIEAIDWLKEPRSQRVSGDSWLDLQDSALIPPKTECSTSNFSDFLPMRCPTGYKCILESEEDRAQEVPNRGQCILFELHISNSVESHNWQEQGTIRTDCNYNGVTYKHGQYFYNQCNFCFCDKGIVSCQLSPCPRHEVPDDSRLPQKEKENKLMSKIQFTIRK